MDVQRRIAAPADVVWDLISSTRHWPSWGPTVRSVDPSDARVHTGMAGAVTTPAGLALRFRITDVDPGRRWSWQVSGVAATDHLVEPVEGGCIATIRVPSWAPLYAPICNLALRRIERMARRRHSAGAR